MRCRDVLRTWTGFLLLVIVGLSTVTCTQKEETTTGPDTSSGPIPAVAVSITVPAQDTSEVDTGVTEVNVRGYLTNTDYLDGLTANLDEIYDSVSGDSFSYTFTIPKDTSTLVVTAFNQEDTARADTVVFIRKIYEDTPVDPVVPSGQAKISGTLLKKGEAGAAKYMAKRTVGVNAAGQSSLIDGVVPVTGADIMIYDADAVSTDADTIVKTDSTGYWTANVEPGSYFAFAVYLDRENFEVVTAALTDIVAEENKETVTDTATAASDDVRPMVMTFLDALEPNSNNMFIANDKIPQNLPIVLTFSEPITRVTAGDSLTGVVLGRVNPSSTDLALLDTIKIVKKWGPSCKELRIYPLDTLDVDSTYRVMIPSGVKDLALNKLDGSYSGLFSVKAAAQLAPFTLAKTVPPSGDTIPLGFPVELVFSRPVDVLTLNKNASVVAAEAGDTIRGYFEGKTGGAKFVNSTPFVQGLQYSMSVTTGVKDLLGDTLDSGKSFSFWITPKDTFEQKAGPEGDAAAFINRFMGALVAGDIESFATALHPNFEEIFVEDGEEFRNQRADFLNDVRENNAFIDRYSKSGILAPVYYQVPWENDSTKCWKLDNGQNAVLIEDLRDRDYMTTIHVFDLQGNDITDSVVFTKRAVVRGTDTLYFDPDFSKSFTDPELIHDDPQLYGKLLQEETDVELGLMTMDFKKMFKIRNLTATSDTAKVMIENIVEGVVTSDFKMEPDMPDTMHEITALQTKLVTQNGAWSVLQMVSKMIATFGGDHDGGPVDDSMFVYDEGFQQTQAIDFVAPMHKAVSVDSPLVLKWNGPENPDLGGYLVAISNELSGGNSGLLIFTRNDSVAIGPKGAVTGGKVLTIRPTSLPVPLPPFEQRLSEFAPSDSLVYLWKVVGIEDTSATTISDTSLFVIADSDFRSDGFGPGVFTMMAEMPDIMMDFDAGPGPGEDMFGDRDGDMYPDWIEMGYGTNPDDPSEYPNFALDTDGDRYPDFMEAFAGTDPQDKASVPTDQENDFIADTLQLRPEWRPELAMDDDGDGFPNEIEFLAATDPWNPESKPTKSIKPSAPVGTWYGFFEPDQSSDRIMLNITITSSDSAGDWVTVDSTDLPNVPRNGIGFSRPLRFSYGEWVFTIPIVQGMQAGKYLKFRFNRWEIVEGPVDIVDDSTMGGPYIGRFMAAETKDYNFDNFMPPPPPGGDPNNMNFGAPPMEVYERSDSAKDLSMTIEPSPYGYLMKVVMDNGDTLVDSAGFWGPGMWPAIGMNTNLNGVQFHLDANLHQSGDAAAGTDTLFLVGPVFTDSEFVHKEYDFVLKITGYDDVWQPTGVWTGWYTERQFFGPPPGGPLPFIGPESALQEALITADSMAILENDSGPAYLRIIEVKSNDFGGPWTVVTDDSTEYFVLEAEGDWQNVMLKEGLEFKQYLVLVDAMDMPMGPMPYDGDLTTVQNALNEANNVGVVDGMMDTMTLSNPRVDSMKGDWIVDGSDGSTYLILADPMDPAMIFFQWPNGIQAIAVMPLDGMGPKQTPIYEGDQFTLESAISSVSSNGVLEGTQTIVAITNPRTNTYSEWIVDADGGQTYLVAGDDMNPGQVRIVNVNGIDAILLLPYDYVDPGPDSSFVDSSYTDSTANDSSVNQINPVPYAGDQTTLQSALASTMDNGIVLGTQMTFSVRNPQYDSMESLWMVEDYNGKVFVVVADESSPGQVAIVDMPDPMSDAIALMDPGQKGPDVAGPYGGGSATVITMLDTGALVTEVAIDSMGVTVVGPLSGVTSTQVTDFTDPIEGPMVIITHNSVDYAVLGDSQGDIAVGKDGDILVIDISN